MTGVLPGGGLFEIHAVKLDPNLSVYVTCGLTNPDMPATVEAVDTKTESDPSGRAVRYQGSLRKKTPAPEKLGAAGYGYEAIVVSARRLQWPLMVLQWVVYAEIAKDIDLLGRIEQYGGLTVEQINVGLPAPINVLFSKAAPPLPSGTRLPAGQMDLIVATVITDEEMRWSQEHGRDALLQKMLSSGLGQISSLRRPGVVEG